MYIYTYGSRRCVLAFTRYCSPSTRYCQKINRSHAHAHNSRTHDSRTNHSQEHRASNASLWESIILSSSTPTCKAYPIAILWHDRCAIYAPLPTTPLCVVHYTTLVMAISCKDQGALLTVTPNLISCYGDTNRYRSIFRSRAILSHCVHLPHPLPRFISSV